MNETKKLYRLDHGALAGVCGGVAEYFNVDANLVRLIWVALCFAGTAGVGLLGAGAVRVPTICLVYPGGAGQRKIRSGGRPWGGRRASVIGIRRRH